MVSSKQILRTKIQPTEWDFGYSTRKNVGATARPVATTLFLDVVLSNSTEIIKVTFAPGKMYLMINL